MNTKYLVVVAAMTAMLDTTQTEAAYGVVTLAGKCCWFLWQELY
jgi:hypothetical protein